MIYNRNVIFSIASALLLLISFTGTVVYLFNVESRNSFNRNITLAIQDLSNETFTYINNLNNSIIKNETDTSELILTEINIEKTFNLTHCKPFIFENQIKLETGYKNIKCTFFPMDTETLEAANIKKCIFKDFFESMDFYMKNLNLIDATNQQKGAICGLLDHGTECVVNFDSQSDKQMMNIDIHQTTPFSNIIDYRKGFKYGIDLFYDKNNFKDQLHPDRDLS